MPAKVIVVGSFNADLVTYLPRLPRPGETLSGRRFLTFAGGKGSNQAVAAARLGAQVTFIGRVGRDVFAEMAFQLWHAEGIHTDYVTQDETTSTGVAAILVEDSGQNVIAVTLGANLALSAADIDRAEAAIAQADVLLTQLEVDQAAAAHALQTARRHGVTTILNPAPAAQLPAAVTALADFLTPNETELLIMSGQPDAERAAAALLHDERQTLIVTLGQEGARWQTQHDRGRCSAFDVQAVDTVGAGDAFNAGLAVALAEGKPLAEALRFANATAAISVTRHGASASMPTRREVDAFLSEHEGRTS